MRMNRYYSTELPKSGRIAELVSDLFAKMPEIESARAVLLTESYRATEGKPIVLRRAMALHHILKHLPIVIRDREMVVGSTTLAPRGCQTYPEFSWEWLEAEFDTVETREADRFRISEQTKRELHEANAYWKGKTSSELADAYMTPETHKAIEHNIFTTGNYYYNGIGHYTCQYEKVLNAGLRGISDEAAGKLAAMQPGDQDYVRKSTMLQAVIISCQAVIEYARRYAALASELAEKTADAARRTELMTIAENCRRVPEYPAQSFGEACQSFWFIQQVLQIESSGHSISPGRFDQYMNPFLQRDLEAGRITRGAAQELIDCIWVKLNDLNKCRDAASAKGFAGYSLFQNLIVGGQTGEGEDATNDVSFMCITASKHVFLPMPSLSIRVWNGSPHDLLMHAASLTRTGIGLPAYYNDEAIIPAMMDRGISLREARNYSIIGCVEPQVPGKTDGWHDAAFFNMCRPLELVFSNGRDLGEQISIRTGEVEEMQSYDEFFRAYQEQMKYLISLLVNSDNAIDVAHATLTPNPFESCLIDDCMDKGLCLEEGGAHFNFTGPQGFGIANVGNALYAVKKLVFDEKTVTMKELKKALKFNFGQGLDADGAAALATEAIRDMRAQGQNVSEESIPAVAAAILREGISEEEKARFTEIWEMIKALPKFGNDDPEVDAFAREAAYCYSKPIETFRNPRGGQYQAGMYPVSANVPLGAQTGATPDGRLAHTPVADGVSPYVGTDVNGPTAACNSVAKLDHMIASNGTLFNMKFHPSALSGESGLDNFINMIRGFFDQKGFHMQFNVVDRDTLLDAQKHPENYQHLVVRVAGYSALFTTLSRSLQDDIISRTEQASTE
ncbi:glycyl radical protein [Lachnoclostridium sp. Marseille-P6806]|uniref:glycyl radical protein n=1 Tax=Lachnoclostridium sp. Marseille-P6806 TaxID=2364793 RepID=UPI00102FFB1F|nr:glycyl radical protein [Lachnoclostridium sp. Marseille-P6806]